MLLHVAEEWFGGFPAWTGVVLGDGVSPEQFLAVNGVGLLLVTAGTLAAWRYRAAAWLAVSFATLLGVNGVLHIAATAAWRLYSPGAVTGLLLSIPLGIAVVRASAGRLSRGVLVGAVLFGILFHAAATSMALS